MKSTETGVLEKSDLYFSSPSQTAKRLYFYPISAGHFFCNEDYHLIRKNYNSLLITHIIDGAFTFIKDGRPFTAHAGDTAVLNCYEPHEYYTDSYFESIWIHAAGANCLDFYSEIEKNEGNIVKCTDAEHVKKMLFRIFYSISLDAPPSERSMSLDIYKLFIDLMNPMRMKSKGENNYEESIHDIKEYILDHLNENLTVKALAESMHMSTSHFSRIFKQQTGFAPYDYVLICRLNKAKYYLQKTDMSVTQIAFETGFNSESNFIYFFTSNTGLSPGKFRKLKF